MAAAPRLAGGADSPIHLLSDELVNLIFSSLDFGGLRACGQTCVYWKGMAAQVLRGWAAALRDKEAEPQASTWCMSMRSFGANAFAALLEGLEEFIGSLAFRPNLAIMVIPGVMSPRMRKRLATAAGESLPMDLVLVALSSEGAMGPMPGDAGAFHEVEIDDDEYLVSLQVQCLPRSSINYFVVPGSGGPVVDHDPPVRRTRGGAAEQGTTYFDHWLRHSERRLRTDLRRSSPCPHTSMLIFAASLNDAFVDEMCQYIDGFPFPIVGGQSSGPDPVVLVFCGANGGLALSGRRRARIAYICVHSEKITLRTCTVCEEWGSGSRLQTRAMRSFIGGWRCQHFKHRLLAKGPPVPKPSAAFIISCTGRGVGFHGSRACEAKALREALGQAGAGVAIAGVFTDGEIGPSGTSTGAGLHSHACVVALFGAAGDETPDEERERHRSVCGFPNCTCHHLGPFDFLAEDFVGLQHPFHPFGPPPVHHGLIPPLHFGLGMMQMPMALQLPAALAQALHDDAGNDAWEGDEEPNDGDHVDAVD